MNIYLISFQVPDGDNQRYQTMVTAIKSFDLWARLTLTSWCIKTDVRTTAEIRSTIKDRGSLQAGERLIVINITNSPWASSNIPKEVADWLKDEN